MTAGLRIAKRMKDNRQFNVHDLDQVSKDQAVQPSTSVPKPRG